MTHWVGMLKSCSFTECMSHPLAAREFVAALPWHPFTFPGWNPVEFAIEFTGWNKPLTVRVLPSGLFGLGCPSARELHFYLSTECHGATVIGLTESLSH